jgi:hypothetical protein
MFTKSVIDSFTEPDESFVYGHNYLNTSSVLSVYACVSQIVTSDFPTEILKVSHRGVDFLVLA